MKQNSNMGNVTLWAAAFFTAALVLVAAGRHTPTANADSASTANGFTLLTTPDGRGSDLLYLIDEETSMLIVYSITNPQTNPRMEIAAAWFLPAMFNTALNINQVDLPR
jgi:hypothetical protein